MKRLFTSSRFPAGSPAMLHRRHPGSIHEGGELGYSLSHAFGAAFDNPDLIVACVIGDGEAETGPLATAWHSNKFLNPVTDGAVLPILHLNGYKISNPTVLARIEHEELDQFLRGCGWTPYFVEGDDPRNDAPTHGRRHGPRPLRTSAGFRSICPHQRDHRSAALADDRVALAQRAGPDLKWLTGSRSRARSDRIRCRFWSIPTIPSMSSS
jgi:hypothetical protein